MDKVYVVCGEGRWNCCDDGEGWNGIFGVFSTEEKAKEKIVELVCETVYQDVYLCEPIDDEVYWHTDYADDEWYFITIHEIDNPEKDPDAIFDPNWDSRTYDLNWVFEQQKRLGIASRREFQ